MITTAAVETLHVEQLGCVPYQEAWQLQKRFHAEIVAGIRPPTLLLLQHPRTITLGASGDRSHLLQPDANYRARGIEVHQVERGGQATYHGPGQLVGYPIVPVRRGVGDYLRMLEGTLVQILAHYGLAGRGSPGSSGRRHRFSNPTVKIVFFQFRRRSGQRCRGRD